MQKIRKTSPLKKGSQSGYKQVGIQKEASEGERDVAIAT